MKRVPKVLVIGDGGVKTGFARVTESILRELHPHFEFHQLAINYRGDPYEIPWKLYPAGIPGDGLGLKRIPELIQKVNPDLIFCVNDFWIQAEYLKVIYSVDKTLKVITYSPVDAGPIDPNWLQSFSKVDLSCVYTEFGKEQLEEGLTFPLKRHIEIIPHGIDSERFYSLGPNARQQARVKLGLKEDKNNPLFIVLNANRNQPRKRIDLTLEGFSEFLKGKEERVRLFLHMGREDLGWDVVKYARRLGIEEKVILTGPSNGGQPNLNDEELNLVYNACDVGINTSGGEGWGLPAFEHAATGAAQVVPDHSACKELWGGAARLIPVDGRRVQPSTLVDFYYPSVKGIKDCLEELFTDRKALEECSYSCFKRATQEELTWEVISKKWKKLFEEILEAEPLSATVPEIDGI